jgi:hypothetical protein
LRTRWLWEWLEKAQGAWEDERELLKQRLTPLISVS